MLSTGEMIDSIKIGEFAEVVGISEDLPNEKIIGEKVAYNLQRLLLLLDR